MKIKNVCKDCGRVFSSKDNNLQPICPKCNSKNTRHSTAMEDHKIKRMQAMGKHSLTI